MRDKQNSMRDDSFHPYFHLKMMRDGVLESISHTTNI